MNFIRESEAMFARDRERMRRDMSPTAGTQVCADGSEPADGKCADGSKPQAAKK